MIKEVMQDVPWQRQSERLLPLALVKRYATLRGGRQGALVSWRLLQVCNHA